jgi:hypothetical protein
MDRKHYQFILVLVRYQEDAYASTVCPEGHLQGGVRCVHELQNGESVSAVVVAGDVLWTREKRLCNDQGDGLVERGAN